MEEIIRSIIAIDKDAENYRKINDEIILKKRIELKREIDAISKEYVEKISSEKQQLTEKFIQNAKEEVERMKLQQSSRINKITEKFNAIKENLQQNAFEILIKSFEEV